MKVCTLVCIIICFSAIIRGVFEVFTWGLRRKPAVLTLALCHWATFGGQFCANSYAGGRVQNFFWGLERCKSVLSSFSPAGKICLVSWSFSLHEAHVPTLGMCWKSHTKNYVATVSKHNITSSISSSPFINLPDANGSSSPGHSRILKTKVKFWHKHPERDFACGVKKTPKTTLLLHFFGFAAVTIFNVIFI